MRKRFVSEPVEPAGAFDLGSLAAGEPGLPEGFSWRGKTHRIVEILEKGKVLRTESFSGEKYVRRHRFRVRMDDDSIWNVYFARQPIASTGRKKSASPRWFLETIESVDSA